MSDVVISTSILELPNDEYNEPTSVPVSVSFCEGETEGVVSIAGQDFYADSVVQLAKLIERNSNP